MQPDGTRPGRDRLSKRGERQERVKQAEYAAKLVRWQHVERVLVQAEHLVLALGAQGERRPADPALPMRPGERVLAVLPALVLVEATRPAGVARPEYARYGARVAAALAFRRPALPAEPQRVRGHGAVTVTSHRVVFHGPSAVTQWPYERLTLVEHATGRPVSLLHLTGEDTVYGLLSRPQDAALVRLLIEYGLAAYAGDVHRLLVGLSVEHRLHALDQPPPPRQQTNRPGPPRREASAAVGSPAAARDTGEPTRASRATDRSATDRGGPAARDNGATGRQATRDGEAAGRRTTGRDGEAPGRQATGRDNGTTGRQATARDGEATGRQATARDGRTAGRRTTGRDNGTASQQATGRSGEAAGRWTTDRESGAAGRVIRAARAPIDEPGLRTAPTAPTAFERVREVLRTALPAFRLVPRRAVLAGIWVVGIAVLAASGTTQGMLASVPRSSPATQADAALGRPSGALAVPAVSTSRAARDEAAPPVEPEAGVSGQPVPAATAVMSASPPRTTTAPSHHTTPRAQPAPTRPRQPSTAQPRLPANRVAPPVITPALPRTHLPRIKLPRTALPSYLR